MYVKKSNGLKEFTLPFYANHGFNCIECDCITYIDEHYPLAHQINMYNLYSTEYSCCNLRWNFCSEKK